MSVWFAVLSAAIGLGFGILIGHVISEYQKDYGEFICSKCNKHFDERGLEH